MSYIRDMQIRARESFDQLHHDVERLTFTDFPDYSNVGDSAIALGQLRFWADRRISVLDTYSCPILPATVFDSESPVFINGGGNFGGLYRPLSEHRYRLAERMRPDALLIQGPQSVHFVNDAAHEEFVRRMAPRARMRIAVRDHHSLDALRPHVRELILSPDAVHLLGEIPAPEPTQRELHLSRADIEGVARAAEGSVDWQADTLDLLIPWWLSWRCQQLPMMKPLFAHPNEWWNARAQKRFSRGVALLARGETIVTDRLHAMLIGLQMGRKVVARDNNNGKLTKYARTWFADSPPENLSWA